MSRQERRKIRIRRDRGLDERWDAGGMRIN